MIRQCTPNDERRILYIINEAAKAYRGAIPQDQYHEPYMSLEELRRESSEITFFGFERGGNLLGAIGYQPVKDLTLVRHLYVLPDCQRRGIGSVLLDHVLRMAPSRRVLVGTWEAATWAIRFYEKHGFRLLHNRDQLLRAYWNIPDRQIETSVVLEIIT